MSVPVSSSLDHHPDFQEPDITFAPTFKVCNFYPYFITDIAWVLILLSPLYWYPPLVLVLLYSFVFNILFHCSDSCLVSDEPGRRGRAVSEHVSGETVNTITVCKIARPSKSKLGTGWLKWIHHSLPSRKCRRRFDSEFSEFERRRESFLGLKAYQPLVQCPHLIHFVSNYWEHFSVDLYSNWRELFQIE